MNLLYLFFAFLFLPTGYLYYTNPEKDYSIEVNNRAHYIRKQLGDGYVDIFNVINENHPNIADYIITVSKITEKEPFSLKVLLSESYRNNFLGSCNCQITHTKLVTFNKNTGVMFSIKTTKSGMAGYSYSFAKGNSIYNINFLTAESIVSKYSAEYTYSLNSIQVLK